MHFRASFFILLACALRRLRCDRNGASAVEFAIVAPLMLVSLFGIIEIAVMFVANQFLEVNTQNIARLIMTGQVKSTGAGSVSKEQFKGLLCTRVNIMFDCANLHVDARPAVSFSAADFSNPISNGEFSDTTQFDTGKQGDVVVVRTFYKWPVFVAGFYTLNLSNLNGNYRLLLSSSVFRNEPW
jgi:Flp pilus assembly protein TadG